MKTTTTHRIPTHRKVLVPLATLAVASTLAVGSGATFTSQSDNTLSAVTSGTLSHSNSKDDAAIFTLTDLKPGDTAHGDLTLTNTGSLPADFGLTETSSTNEFTGELLGLTITNRTTGPPSTPAPSAVWRTVSAASWAPSPPATRPPTASP